VTAALRVLTSDEGEDRQSWLDAWEATGAEPFAHPDYVRLFLAPGHTALAALLESGDGCVLMPYIRRPLVDVAGSTGDGTDVVSPYGYGGPFCEGSAEAATIIAPFVAWMRDEHVVTAFLRLSLDVPPLEVPPPARVVHLADNVVVDLDRSSDEIWRDYEHKVRKNVNKARRAGMSVTSTRGFQNVSRFHHVYSATMRRRSAADWYHFDEAFFLALERAVPNGMRVFETLDERGLAVSVEVALESGSRFYSFLGGTLPEAFPHAPNDLLKHSIIETGVAEGKREFVLGGGYAAGDGIFRYKRSFAPQGTVAFRGLQICADPVTYSLLARFATEAAARNSMRLVDNFFPAYRSPAVSLSSGSAPKAH
jgi:CelD/BcsL family acetyltransferase involved in cellulose biosynthesis